jgi:hypothetical protein
MRRIGSKQVGSAKMIIQTIFISLVSAFIGASLKLFYDLVIYKREKIAMLHAAASEIESLIDIAEFRDYENTLSYYAECLKRGDDIKIFDFIGDIDQWRPIYKNSVSKIGMFGAESSAKYIKFHTRVASISRDLKNSEIINKASPIERAEIVEDMRSLWKLAKEDGSTAVISIRNQIQNSFFRHFC